MGRKHTLKAEPDDEPELSIAPLIDVSFLLLIYFLVTSTLQKREADLGLQLPTQNPDSSATDVQIDQMTIEVDAEGAVIVNSEVLDSNVDSRDLPLLTGKLDEYKRIAELSQSKPLVVVAADDLSKGQRLVDVLNALADADITHVTLTGFKED
ncbi:MAG: biopolymer transporter ExbD [Verrucomicrobiota bacterium]